MTTVHCLQAGGFLTIFDFFTFKALEKNLDTANFVHMMLLDGNLEG
jgi:hypothetical protein